MRDNMNHTNTRFSVLLKTLVTAVVLGVSLSASAQTVDDWSNWSVKVFYNNLSPQGTSGALSAPSIANSTFTAGSDAQPVVAFAYNFTNHLVAELGLGTPYSSKLAGAGALQGVSNLGSAKLLPLTLFGQYHFLDETSAFRPYVGLGVTYAMFRDEQGSGTLTAISNPGGPPTTFTLDNAWGVTPEIGLTYAFNSKWSAIVVVSKFYVSTTVHLSTGQTANAPLNPIATAVGVGYRF
jgi:outer membrane protein